MSEHIAEEITTEDTGTTTRNPYGAHHEEFIEQIFGPFVENLINQGGDFGSIAAVHRAYREAANSNISMATFRRWMADAGYEFETVRVELTRSK